MDLSLQGSQINLAVRQKPKPKYNSQTNLHLNHSFARPRSASFAKRTRSQTSLFLRPQSADPRLRRHFGSSCGQYYSETDFQNSLRFCKNNQSRYQSVSSSNLLKLLLDEPIKRSWLCRGINGEGSSPDQSELSTSHKTASSSSLNKRHRTESVGGSSIEGEYFDKSFRSGFGAARRSAFAKMSTSSSLLSLNNDKNSNLKNTGGAEFWENGRNNSGVMIPRATKPDLPGRVSFSKPSLNTGDLDSSDCDNDKQEHFGKYNMEQANTKKNESISAPGPVVVSSYDFQLDGGKKREELSSAGLKKSVHFGAAGAGEVLAQTYEYPKCPSDNCSCSTRSSSTASIQDAYDNGKCACDSENCKFAIADSTPRRTSAPDLMFEAKPRKLDESKIAATNSISPLEDSAVIREYKNAVGEQLNSTVVKNILEDKRSKTEAFSKSLNNSEKPFFATKYGDSKSDIVLEKQNNLSPECGISNTYKTSSNGHLLASCSNNVANNIETKSTSCYATTSEAVINNYLKVTASAPGMTKKKENNNGNSLSTEHSNKKRNCSSAKTPKSSTERHKLKKANSIGSLQDDSNLNEFHLDKVDSWMSMNEQHTLKRHQNISKHASIENNLESFSKSSDKRGDSILDDELGSNSQISLKSDENSQEDSTYEEIVSVIKEIEEDKKKDNMAEQTVNMELKLHNGSEMTEESETSVLTKHEQLVRKSEDKYNEILSYLDNVEDSCDKTLLETRRSIPESNRSEVEFVIEPDIAEDVPKLSDLLMLPNHQLARRVVALSLRANELANAVHLAKEHIIKVRTEKQKSIRAEKSNSTNRMKEQKKHYETIVKRHQGFIEQLLKDKGSLCEKAAALTRRLESQNQAWEHKLETEMTRVKETTMAGEKIRRERWVRENTKKIKELTVKGLESEINKMACKHQDEINDIKRLHQEALLEQRLKHEQIENKIRESQVQDRETIIEKERTAIRERFDRQLEEEHKSFDEQKQKLCEDFAAERERFQSDLKAKDNEFQFKRQEMQREKENELEQLISELQEKMSKQEEKYQNRINTIEKQYEADFELWKRDFENNCKMECNTKENSIREHYRAERDRQIDAIVGRMDAEALKNTKEFEAKIKRLKEKYERDLQESETTEKNIRDKYTETRSNLAESDAQVRNYQAEIKQLQIELDHCKKMCSEFLNERDQLRENVRQEIQNEVATIKTERDIEIQKIHKRVQQAIEKKDTTIDILQKENGSLRERCIKLEAVIRQQRKDYCVK